MSHPDAEQTSWTEAEVDTELRRFFRQEVPASLPAEPKSQNHPPPRTAVTRKVTAARVGVAGTVAVLLVCAMLILNFNFGQRSNKQPSTTQLPRTSATESAWSLDSVRRPVESPAPLEAVHEGAAAEGDGILEWEINVFPIDDQPATVESADYRPAVAEPGPSR